MARMKRKDTWRFWDDANAGEELNFEPVDDAERFRVDVTKDSA